MDRGPSPDPAIPSGQVEAALGTSWVPLGLAGRAELCCGGGWFLQLGDHLKRVCCVPEGCSSWTRKCLA